MFLKYLSLTLILLTTACTDLKQTVVNKMAESRADYILTENLVYGGRSDQKLDVYRPKEVAKAPVIVFFYGGSWQEGVKKDYTFVAQAFTEAGYVVVIPDYGKSPQHPYPVFMNDAAMAVRWVENKIAVYNGDPDNIALVGHSAGGHMATLLATHPEFLKDKSAIKAVVGLSGAYDFTPQDPDIKRVFKNVDPTSNAMPATYINGQQTAMLLIWGAEDGVVGERNINRMKAAIDQNGGRLDVLIEPNLDHAGTVAAFSIPKRDDSRVYGKTLQFLKTYLNY